MRALRRLFPLLLLVAAVLAAGCGVKGMLKPNLPPETTLFLQGPVDTVNHVVHLYWFGTDVDGTITGFEIRFFNPVAPADTNWEFTTRTDSVFTIQAPAGFTAPRFEVRAIDDKNQRDPSPAVEDFKFSNKPPVVTLTTRPAVTDSTYGSLTVAWNAADIDGDPTRMQFRIWLDGQQANPIVQTGNSLTVPTSRFYTSGSTYTSGYRQLFVQAIDDGGMAGNVDSCRWFVRRPVAGTRARLLIVDDVPTTATANFRVDTLYYNTAARNLAPDEYSILKLQFTKPFKSAKDIEQTFKQFEAVVWYRGTELSTSTTLRDYGNDGIGPYLQAGGKFYLEGLYLFAGLNAPGPLPESFIRQFLNSRGLYQNFQVTGAFTDSTAGWGNLNGSVFYSDVLADSIKQQQLVTLSGQAGGLRAFIQNDVNDVLLWGRSGTLIPAAPDSLPIAMSVGQSGGGRAVIVTVPLGASQFFSGAPSFNAAPRFLAKIFQQMGLTGP